MGKPLQFLSCGFRFSGTSLATEGTSSPRPRCASSISVVNYFCTSLGRETLSRTVQINRRRAAASRRVSVLVRVAATRLQVGKAAQRSGSSALCLISTINIHADLLIYKPNVFALIYRLKQ
jgi:hypothetical protein